MLDPRNLKNGRLRAELGGLLFIDMSNIEDPVFFERQVEVLVKEITRLLILASTSAVTTTTTAVSVTSSSPPPPTVSSSTAVTTANSCFQSLESLSFELAVNLLIHLGCPKDIASRLPPDVKQHFDGELLSYLQNEGELISECKLSEVSPLVIRKMFAKLQKYKKEGIPDEIMKQLQQQQQQQEDRNHLTSKAIPIAEKTESISPPAPALPPPPVAEKAGSLFSRLFGSSSTSSMKPSSLTATITSSEEEILTVTDFDLLKLIGKTETAKMLLVRKKQDGKCYAMKIFRKEVIAARKQIEQVKTERDILFAVRHPFLLRLRYAFQSEAKLYLITDYSNGGSLFDHLRNVRQFSEARAKFYAAELLLAVDYLHQLQILYRYVKLENIFLDYQGHIILTNFRLAKQHIDIMGGKTKTFCGSSEYLAPEVLKGQAYGVGVDWWSFGVLLYEMIEGQTPFYDKNRKLMFYRIMNILPKFSDRFSTAAVDCIQRLLTVDETQRLGGGPRGGEEMMRTDFFKEIDFEALLRREVTPPFFPEVTNEFDTKYVAKKYLVEDANDSSDEDRSSTGKSERNLGFEEFSYVP